MNFLRLAFVSAGFLGLSPIAPGTCGTLAGVALVYALAASPWYGYWVLGLCVLFYVVGRRLGPWAEARAGGKDPGFYVLDEVIGYMITMLGLAGPSFFAMLVGFCLFRLFDIWKPPPARAMEALGGGDGILLDDVIAGGYGLLGMLLLRGTLGTEALWQYDAARWPFGG